MSMMVSSPGLIRYTLPMNYRIILVGILLIPLACSEGDTAPVPTPLFPEEESQGSGEDTEPIERPTDTQTEVEPGDTVATDTIGSDSAEQGDAEGENPSGPQQSDVQSDVEDGATDVAPPERIADTTQEPTDILQEIDTKEEEELDGEVVPDGTTGDGLENPEEDTTEEEEGECQKDSDCLLLTAKECCPALGVCPGMPEAGTLEEEVEALSWIQTECPTVESCPPLEEPACTECTAYASVEAICDLELGECVAKPIPDCDIICTAEPSPSGCPLSFTGGALIEDLATECACP